jgi:ketosteroid isomerase-like protein
MHAPTPGSQTNELLEQFTRVFAEEDTETLFSILSPECEWQIMPTGERFVGLEEIRGLVDQVQKAREHSAAAKVEICDAFGGGDRLCVEFLHRGIVTGGFSSGAINPTPGSTFEMDFCATALVKNGKIVRVREYFDHTHFSTPPDQRVKFFS